MIGNRRFRKWTRAEKKARMQRSLDAVAGRHIRPCMTVVEKSPPVWHKKAVRIIRWIAFGAVAYIVSAYTAYRFAHPELSETELFLNFWEAMTWK